MLVWAGLRFRPLDASDDNSTIASKRSTGSIPSTRKAPAHGVSKMRLEEEEEEEGEEEVVPKKKSDGYVKKSLPPKKRFDEDDEDDYDQGIASPSKMMSASGRKPASRKG